MSVFVRSMQENDIPLVIQVHLTAFPNFFLSFLGRRFLCQLYSAILVDPSGIADKIREITEMDPQELASIGLAG